MTNRVVDTTSDIIEISIPWTISELINDNTKIAFFTKEFMNAKSENILNMVFI